MIAYDTPSGFIITNFPLNQNSKFTRLSFPPLLHRTFLRPADPVSFCGSFSISRENTHEKGMISLPSHICPHIAVPLIHRPCIISRPDRTFALACSLRMICTSSFPGMWSMSVCLSAVDPLKLKPSSSHRSLYHRSLSAPLFYVMLGKRQ